MSDRKSLMFAACTLLALASAPAALGQSYDQKAISPMDCQPYAPDTGWGDVQFTPTGIYNPGTTTEKVICALPRDAETGYTMANYLVLTVYYRVIGASPGRLTCTIFVSSTSMTPNAVTTVTASGPLASGGARNMVDLTVSSQPSPYVSNPNSLVCAISPKTSMGGIYFYEQNATDYVEPPA